MDMSLHSVQLLMSSVQSDTIAQISYSVQRQTWNQEIDGFLEAVDSIYYQMEEEVAPYA